MQWATVLGAMLIAYGGGGATAVDGAVDAITHSTLEAYGRAWDEPEADARRAPPRVRRGRYARRLRADAHHRILAQDGRISELVYFDGITP